MDDAVTPDPVVTELDRPTTEANEELIVVHDEERGRYRALLGDTQVAVMHARVGADGVVTITAVIVDAMVRGRGIATDLIAYVLDGLRASGTRIVPQCAEVERFIAHHPDYARMVA